MKKIFSAIITLCVCSLSTYAQVKFKLTRQLDRQTYIVSMVSEETYKSLQNITGTAQVTLKVGNTSNFIIRDITPLQPETKWVNNATINNPSLAPTFSYLSFGMETMGHNQFKYDKGIEIPLFSFKNMGDLKAEVSLLNNDQDVMAQSSQVTKYNIKNHISILGHGTGNAYLGNIESRSLSPDESMKTYVQIKNIYPNPVTAADKVTLVWENELEDAESTASLDIVVFDATGIEKLRKPVSTSYGKQTQTITLQSFKSGMYLFKLQRDEQYSSHTYQLMVIE